MPKIRAVIADDEPTGRRTVRLLLAADTTIEVVGECASGVEAVEAVLYHEPDLLFLDVQMPGRDGFAVLAKIPPDTMPLVIFVTAFDEYALRAFDVAAADYLLKPFTDERFHAAVDRAKARLALRVPGQPFLERIAIPANHTTRLVPVREIEWIEARGDYVGIHGGGRVDLLREPIGHLEARLDPKRFVRVHRSAIVNLAYVREIRCPPFSGPVAVLQSGQHCPLSRSGRRRLEHVLGQAV